MPDEAAWASLSLMGTTVAPKSGRPSASIIDADYRCGARPGDTMRDDSTVSITHGSTAPRHDLERRLAIASKVLLLLLAMYLLWPIAHSVHSEGFSAQIQIAAIARHFDALDRANLSYPVHAEYFFLSRAGVVVMLQALMAITGRVDDQIFRILMIASTIVLVAASIVFARRHGGASAWWSGAALLLTPGISELPFTFNDNLVSAAFGAAGLALIPSSHAGRAAVFPYGGGTWTRIGLMLSGASLAVAIVCRPDALLLLPLAACLCWLIDERLARRIVALIWTSCGVVAGLVALRWLTGSTVLQAIGISRYFETLHTNAGNHAELLWTVILFFGFPQMAVIPLGVAKQWRHITSRTWGRRMALVVGPAFLLLYSMTHSIETRQFYPLLTPFVALFGGEALRSLVVKLCTQKLNAMPGALALMSLIVFVSLSPPVYVRLRDGPRAPLGRLASPFVWRDWQRMVVANRDILERLVDDASQPIDGTKDSTFLTTFFDTDHYLILTLWQHGYRPHYAQEVFPTCNGGFEVWTGPSGSPHRIFHIRLENPHVSQRPFAYVQAVQLQRAWRCDALLRAAPVTVIGIGQNSPEPRSNALWALLHPAPGRDQVAFGWHPFATARLGRIIGGQASDWLAAQTFDRQRVELLNPSRLPLLVGETARVVSSFDGQVPPGGYEHVMSRYAAQVSWPQYEDGRWVWMDRRAIR